MDNIEQLKQNNAKLTERLNNAAKFFREQKAQIEALTKENKELKNSPKEEVIDTEKWNSLVTEKEELKNTIDSKDKAYKVLQDTYNEVFAEKEKLVKQIKEFEKFEAETINVKVPELQEKLDNAKKIIEDNKLDYDKLQKEHDALNETYNKLNNEYSDIYTKYNDLEQGRIKSEEQLNALNTLCIQMKEENKELTDKYDNVCKICDDYENHKLAVESDYQGLLQMYNELQNEYEILRNERDTYSQSDDTLAEITKILIDKGFVDKNQLTPQQPIKESGTAHRMGDNMVGGDNIGV